MREVDGECSEIVPDAAVWLTFVKFGCITEENIPIMRNIDLKSGLSESLKIYMKTPQCICYENFGSFGRKKSGLALDPGGGERQRLWDAIV